MRSRQSLRDRHTGRWWCVALALLPALLSASAISAPYPFPAPAVQCRRDLAWLSVTLPEVLPARGLPVGSGRLSADADTDADDLFIPAAAAHLPPALRVWQQLQQARYCELARALRHGVA